MAEGQGAEEIVERGTIRREKSEDMPRPSRSAASLSVPVAHGVDDVRRSSRGSPFLLRGVPFTQLCIRRRHPFRFLVDSRFSTRAALSWSCDLSRDMEVVPFSGCGAVKIAAGA